MDIFQRLKDERGHYDRSDHARAEVADYGSRIIRFKDGRIVEDRPNSARRQRLASCPELRTCRVIATLG